MTSTSILRRNTDGRLFWVKMLAHWSHIATLEGEGREHEADIVKCYGPDMYVSADKGCSYTLVHDWQTQHDLANKAEHWSAEAQERFRGGDLASARDAMEEAAQFLKVAADQLTHLLDSEEEV